MGFWAVADLDPNLLAVVLKEGLLPHKVRYLFRPLADAGVINFVATFAVAAIDGILLLVCWGDEVLIFLV